MDPTSCPTNIDVGRTALDADLLAAIADLPGMTAGTAEAEPVAFPARVPAVGNVDRRAVETDRETVRVGGAHGFGQEAQTLQILGRLDQCGLPGRLPRLLQRDKPFIGDQRRSLRDEMPAIGGLVAPALLQMDGTTRCGFVLRLVLRRGDNEGGEKGRDGDQWYAHIKFHNRLQSS